MGNRGQVFYSTEFYHYEATLRRSQLNRRELYRLNLAIRGYGRLDRGYDCNEITGGIIMDAPDAYFAIAKNDRIKEVEVSPANCWSELPRRLRRLNRVLDRIVERHFSNQDLYPLHDSTINSP